jgi:mono/diheme cytochrome c family protein
MTILHKISTFAVGAIMFIYIKSTANEQAVANVWDGAYTEAQAERGANSYQDHCSECHGTQMQGREEAPTLKQGAFVYNWDGMPVSVLFQRLRETMPLDDPRGTPRKVKADILAYIMKQNNFPAGKVPLPYQNSRLKRIMWNAQNPAD